MVQRIDNINTTKKNKHILLETRSSVDMLHKDSFDQSLMLSLKPHAVYHGKNGGKKNVTVVYRRRSSGDMSSLLAQLSLNGNIKWTVIKHPVAEASHCRDPSFLRS